MKKNNILKSLMVVAIMALPMMGCDDQGVRNSENDKSGEAKEGTYEVKDYPEASALTLDFTAGELTAAAGLRDFGVDFFEATANTRADKNGNFVVSPLSASLFAGMMANIVDDEQVALIANMLGSENLDDVNNLCRKLLVCLPGADTSSQLAFANALWHRQEYTVNSAFETIMGQYYTADVLACDFSNAKAFKNQVNSWVAQKTNDRITEIEFDVTDELVAILANAMYFKSDFETPFGDWYTHDAKFFGVDKTSTVKMMSDEFGFKYRHDDVYSAATQKLGNGTYEAIFVLPNDAKASLIDADALKDILLADNQEIYLAVNLPRFDVESEKEFIDPVFESFGVKGLCGVPNNKLFTQTLPLRMEVFQKNSFSVREEGVEGASVTYGGMVGATGEEAPKPTTLTFNRPFLFFVTETVTGNILFAGRVLQL